jgi:hypothetical protein
VHQDSFPRIEVILNFYYFNKSGATNLDLGGKYATSDGVRSFENSGVAFPLEVGRSAQVDGAGYVGCSISVATKM